MNRTTTGNSTGANWPKATKDRPCPECGKTNRCLIAPDGGATVCWRGDGKAKQLNSSGHINGNGHATGYVGAANRTKPKPATNGKPPEIFPTPEAAFAEAGKWIKRGKLVKWWSYPGDLFRIGRWDITDGDPPKTCRPIHRVDGGWAVGDPLKPLSLYRADELPATGTVYVVEGEKCADCGWSIDLPCVTSALGSSSAKESDWTPLAGRDAVIFPDNDDTGRQYARDVATILARLGCRVKIVQLPGLGDGGDIADYVADRPDERPHDIAIGIIALADAVPWIGRAELIGGPVLTCLADVAARTVDWLWPNRIPKGRIALGAGRPGCGKSFVAGDIGAHVTTGTPWPDAAPCEVGNVLLIAPEDDAGDTHRPRLEAAGADLNRVYIMTTVRRVDENGKPHDLMFTLEDLAALETTIQQVRPALVIFDPIGSLIGGDVKTNVDNATRAVLAPVAMLLAKYNAAGFIVAHTRKASGTSADDSVMGTRAFTGIARVVWHFSRDPQNPARRLFLPGKNNLAPEGDGLAFTIEGQPVGRVVWEPEPVKMTADDALANENETEGPGRPAHERKEAEQWLQAELADLEEHKVDDIRQSANAAGFSWRTVQRARREIGAMVHKAGFGTTYVWRLPRPGIAVADLPCVPQWVTECP